MDVHLEEKIKQRIKNSFTVLIDEFISAIKSNEIDFASDLYTQEEIANKCKKWLEKTASTIGH